jgi:hypothetical protein
MSLLSLLSLLTVPALSKHECEDMLYRVILLANGILESSGYSGPEILVSIPLLYVIASHQPE